MTAEVRVLATCSLGLGFSSSGLKAGLAMEPHAIACDAGSSDFGPYYLGANLIQKSKRSVKRDLGLLIGAARTLGIPFMTGSVGGAGGDAHVAGTVQIVREIATEQALHFRMAAISAAVSSGWLVNKIREGRVQSVGDVAPLTEDAVGRLSSVVAMMGEEPYLRALEEGADVIIAGRSTDPAIFVGVPLRGGIPPDVAWHAAKSIDKGYLATTRPQDGSPVLARMGTDSFVLEPTRKGSACTVASVASLTLHENPDPFEVAQPTGTIDTRDAVYEQLDARRVRVSGSRYVPAAKTTLKIEGAELVGYRTILIAGMRDPRVLARLDEFLEAYRALLGRTAHSLGIAETDYKLQFRVYGKDAVMGAFEPVSQPAHEVGLIVDLVGRTEEISAGLGTRLGPTGSRLDITGKMGGGGNFAYPFSPSLIKVGPVYQWTAWHLVETDDREMRELFTIGMHDL